MAAAQPILDFSDTQLFNGLGTFSVTAPVACPALQINVQNMLPSISTGASANSSVVTVVKQNSTTIYTGTAGATGAQCVISPVAAGDTISVIFSSSNAVDQGFNVVKSTITYSIGIGV